MPGPSSVPATLQACDALRGRQLPTLWGGGRVGRKAEGGDGTERQYSITSNLTEVKTAQGNEQACLNHPETKLSSGERGLTFI